MGNIKKFGFVCYLLAVLVSSNFLGSSALATEPRDLESFDITRPGQDAGPTEVSTAVWLLDIDSINSSAQNFIANAFIALRWKDPRLSHNDKIKRSYSVDEVWSPRIQIANEIGIVRRTLPEVVDVEPDGTASYMQRFVGPFSQPLVLNEFPFDSQTFQLHFLSSGSGPEDIVFLQDKTWIEDGVPKAAGISDDISLPDWKVESYDTFSEPYIISPHVNNAGYIFQFKAS
ncbi:MAG: hypothetical protein HN337_03640, partial [Deltaproteobacteria bacterium]|nr:hypothetical protein [Deltaproteobacteria bacterium]